MLAKLGITCEVVATELALEALKVKKYDLGVNGLSDA